MCRNNRYFEVLADVAKDLEPVSKAKVVACIVYKKRIVAIGMSQYKTHPFQNEYKKNDHAVYLHAEVDAINKAKKRLSAAELSKSSIYICRVKKDVTRKKDTFGIAKPCSGCSKCISAHGIKNVYYTNNTETFNLSYTFSEWS